MLSFVRVAMVIVCLYSNSTLTKTHTCTELIDHMIVQFYSFLDTLYSLCSIKIQFTFLSTFCLSSFFSFDRIFICYLCVAVHLERVYSCVPKLFLYLIISTSPSECLDHRCRCLPQSETSCFCG